MPARAMLGLGLVVLLVAAVVLANAGAPTTAGATQAAAPERTKDQEKKVPPVTSGPLARTPPLTVIAIRPGAIISGEEHTTSPERETYTVDPSVEYKETVERYGDRVIKGRVLRPGTSIGAVLMAVIGVKDVTAAVQRYRELKANADSGMYDFSESELSKLGHRLLEMNRAPDAVEIFKLNVEAYPASAHAQIELGDAYLALGDKRLATDSFRKVLALNPNEVAAIKKLATLAPR